MAVSNVRTPSGQSETMSGTQTFDRKSGDRIMRRCFPCLASLREIGVGALGDEFLIACAEDGGGPTPCFGAGRAVLHQ